MNIINKAYKTERLFLYFFIICTSMFSYLMFLYFNIYFDVNKDYTFAILPLSWIGIMVIIYIVFTWYKLTGKLFTLYTIFMMFFLLFNYGQPLLWTIGIHDPNEIGQVGLYTLGKPTASNIVYTQVLTLIGIVMFHLGAFFCYKPVKKVNKKGKTISKKNLNRKAIFYTSVILGIIVIPVTFYNSLYDFIYAQSHGYRALYYDDNKSEIVLFNIIQHFFFPVIIGLLIGSNYKKNVMYFVYAIFSIYMIVNLLSGDRGSWIFYLLLLIFMSHSYYKKIELKKTLFYGLIGYLLLYLVNIITSIRNTGINTENILNAFSLQNSPIVSALFEMGSSMRPALVLIQYGWDVYPYGNSYFNAFVGIISSKTFEILNKPFDALSSWFSQDYLDIPYGAAFSIIAEPLINYGPILTPLVLGILGYVIGSLTYIDKDFDIDNNPLKILFAISTMSVFLPLVRNHSHFILKSWFYGVILFFILIWLVKQFLQSKIHVKKIPLGDT